MQVLFPVSYDMVQAELNSSPLMNRKPQPLSLCTWDHSERLETQPIWIILITAAPTRNETEQRRGYLC